MGQDLIDNLIAKGIDVCERLNRAVVERDEQRIRADDLERRLAECELALARCQKHEGEAVRKALEVKS